MSGDKPAASSDQTDGIGIPPRGPVAEVAAISLDIEEYGSKARNRGKCLIINQHHFDQIATGQQDRDGTDVDAAALEGIFSDLGFDVERKDDLRTLDMQLLFRNIASDEDYHKDVDCFVAIILSHGKEGIVYGTNGTIRIDYLVNMFKGDACPALAGKPKLFFIQACRGTKFDHGVKLQADGDEVDSSEAQNIIKIPVEADILLAYSVAPGHFSWRNNYDGSWFIQALCSVLKTHGSSMDLLHMLTMVNKRVAYDFKSCTDEAFTADMKQMPCIVSMLTHLMYFRPKP